MSRDCGECEFNEINEYLLAGDDRSIETLCMHPDLDRGYPDNMLPNFTATPPEWCPLGAEDDDD